MNHYLPTSNLTLEGFHFWFIPALKSMNDPNCFSPCLFKIFKFFFKIYILKDISDLETRGISEKLLTIFSLKDFNSQYMKHCMVIF